MKSKRIFQEEIIKTEKLIESKIPFSNSEEIFERLSIKNKSQRNSYRSPRVKKFTKREADKVIKIQRWWRSILYRKNPYRKNQRIYFNRNKEILEENIYPSSSSQEKGKNKYDFNSIHLKHRSINSNSSYNTNINSYSNNTNMIQNNLNSKSYSNINTNTFNLKNTNLNINTSTNNNYIQTMARKTEILNIPQNLNTGSLSSSPSEKSRYLIETKKVEIFRKPKNNSDNKTFSKSSKNSVVSFSEISKYEVKNMMKNIWNEESFCSTVESLSCISDNNKSNSSQNNTYMVEEYEEEINKLRTLLIEKDNELNNLITNLNQRNTIHNKSKNWNEANVPSPINEIQVESIKNNSQNDLNYTESVSNSEAVLEIQEMNALSIISTKKKYKNICQHLQSMSILKKNNLELSDDYPIERLKTKEKLRIQKIEEINVTSIIPRRENLNKIQELDGIQILSLNSGSKKKKLIMQNLDTIFIKSFLRKKRMIIQELDGLEIIKGEKQINILPQCVDELLIPREYDMLLVKPKWNKLKIQGNGLNILAMGKNVALENQEMDEFNISGLAKPELLVQSQEKISFSKANYIQKVKVIIPLPENTITQMERFEIKGKEKIKEPDLILNIEQSQKLKIPKAYEALVTEKEINWNEKIKPMKATKVLIKSDYSKMKNLKKIIQKEEIETIERIYNINNNWNKEIKPIKTTKLYVKGIKNNIIWDNLLIEEKNNIYLSNNNQKEKEELIIESFAFNLAENNKKLIQKLFIEKISFNLLNNNIKKQNILIPCKNENISLFELNKKKTVLKANKENYLFIRGKIKKINWNELNLMEHNKDINIIHLKNNKKPNLIKQFSNIINLLGKELSLPQKNWKNLRAQKSGKFALLSKQINLSKKNKINLLVANGDKFFIQKELEDEIIYNDDYNSRKENESQKENENSDKEIRTEIIKEKEIIPRYQREIRAQIAKVKEISESDSSSLSEIDVLEGIKNKKNINKELINIANGYQTQVINGEVIYTAKNGLKMKLNTEEQSKTIIENKIINNNDSFKQSGVKKQIIINTNKNKNISLNNENMNGQSIINNNSINHKINNDMNMSPKFPDSEKLININEMNQQNKKGQIIFNPKIKTLRAHHSTISANIPHSGNIIINSRKEYEKKLKSSAGNNTDRQLKENKEGEVIKIKRSRIKNIELLRDYDTQNNSFN